MCILDADTNSVNQEASEEKFSQFGNDVDGAFMYLLNKLEELWSEANCHSLKKICVRDIRLSENLRQSIEDVSKLDKVFDLLRKSPYFTWFEIRILQRMATVADNVEAKCLIECYKSYVFSKPCSAVQPYFYKQYIIPDHLTQVIAKLNVNPDKVTVNNLIEYCRKLDGVAGLPPGSTTLVDNKKGCLEIVVVIPTYYSFYAYIKAKSILLKFRLCHIQHLQVGCFHKLFSIGFSDTVEAIKDLASTAGHCKLCCKCCQLKHMVCCVAPQGGSYTMNILIR